MLGLVNITMKLELANIKYVKMDSNDNIFEREIEFGMDIQHSLYAA